MRRIIRSLGLLIVIAFICASCSRATPTPTELLVIEPTKPAESNTPEVEGSPTESSTPELMRPPTESPPAATPSFSGYLPQKPLSEGGPWWVFFSGVMMLPDGFWAVNPDGSGLTCLSNNFLQPVFLKPDDLRSAFSPTGGYGAIITADSSAPWQGLTLNLLTLPQGELRPLTPLLSSEFEDQILKQFEEDPALRPPEALLAIIEENSFAWSPDGQFLAFVGVLDGPTADLYMYSMADGTVKRLTSGSTQAIRPTWSPDGNYIVHFGIETLGSGAGYRMGTAWAAQAHGKQVISLYDASGSADEVILGWIDDETFLVYSWDINLGGKRNLRTVNINSGEIRTLWEGAFLDAALEPEGGNIILLIDQASVSLNSEGKVGLFHLDSQGNAYRFLEDEPAAIAWSSRAGLFFARTRFGLIAIAPSGEWVDILNFTGNIPAANPVVKQLVWYGEQGVWVGNLLNTLDSPQPQKIFDEVVRYASWNPAGDGLFFITENENLYVAVKPAYRPVLVVEGLPVQDSIWVVSKRP
ncbi:MAG: PD40 domain-containing protein [Anaerolineales bacterium]|nr:PD40 domain-containing protein [Anaerolineales bacterium]